MVASGGFWALVTFVSVVWQTALEIGGINDLAKAELPRVALALNPLGLQLGL
jgi:hypothetical protein